MARIRPGTAGRPRRLPLPPIGRLVGPGGATAGVQGGGCPLQRVSAATHPIPESGWTEHDSGPERLSCSGVAAIPGGDESVGCCRGQARCVRGLAGVRNASSSGEPPADPDPWLGPLRWPGCVRRWSSSTQQGRRTTTGCWPLGRPGRRPWAGRCPARSRRRRAGQAGPSTPTSPIRTRGCCAPGRSSCRDTAPRPRSPAGRSSSPRRCPTPPTTPPSLPRCWLRPRPTSPQPATRSRSARWWPTPATGAPTTPPWTPRSRC